MCSFNCLFNDKLSSVSNLIFTKSLLYTHFLLPFIVSSSFLISFQISVYIFNILLCFHPQNQKLNIFSHFFLQYVHLLYQLSDTKDLHCKYFHNHQFFQSQCIQYKHKHQYLCMIHCLFLVSLNQIPQFNYVIVSLNFNF